MSVFKFLLFMDDVAGKELNSHYVERGFSPNPVYISAINKCIVAFKLLQAISFFIGGADRVRFYGEYVRTYMDMREIYEAIISMRSAVAKKVEGVEGGTEELDVC
ncbi:hypothetical protein COY05_04560 [Candidatus Peregrinibacteria bacterium CG_4_10_14_0_2_um_filter_38_24]|nr:MAG: hypothetical protein COY05_04560 [Candidatus Peregrinibacteria bacterium CG_4_10_14_0_2_um_filter_38_24]PJC38572.1 MAG: hypothetical protein CO044_04305 [Candidatus Peregrinibacteria bacterium CG_4_9_14_0_2_um_filter_38_9]